MLEPVTSLGDVISFVLLAMTIFVTLICRRNGSEVAREVSVLLLVQFLLANYFYERGEIETEATVTSMVVIAIWALWLRMEHQHWLPLAVLISALTILLWTLIAVAHDYSAFTFKAVKNAIYAGEVIACLSAYLQASSSPGSWR